MLSGLAIVALGAGITGVAGRNVAHQPVAGFERLDLGALSELAWIGRIVFSQNIMIYVCILIVLVTWWAIENSRYGLKLRAVGEDPATADTAGVNVLLYRFFAVLLSGAFCGLAGAYLSIASSQVWVEGMVAGRGWIAIALVIFARWRPLRALAGADSLIPRLQVIGADVPVYLMQALPYLLTLAVLVIPAVMFRRPDVSPSASRRTTLAPACVPQEPVHGQHRLKKN